jgi:hypothetical protein
MICCCFFVNSVLIRFFFFLNSISKQDFGACILLYYLPSQLLGAFCAGLLVYAIWSEVWLLGGK